jgi:hypothetical protein
MKKKTDWFPSFISPYRNGVYEVRTPNNFANKYVYFDKNGWRLCARTVKGAEKEKPRITNLSSMTLFMSQWRGFTERQK